MFPPQEVFAASFTAAVREFPRAVAHCYARSREVVHDDDVDVDATAGIVESASGTDIDDDAATQDNRADVSVAASAPTPRRLRDLPARRKAAANAVPRSQPVASTSQSQSTICPVCLAVNCG